MLLDKRFEDLLRELFGYKTYSDMSLKTKATAAKYWQDHIKPNFVGKLSDDEFSDVDYFVPMPGVADNLGIHLEEGFLQLDRYYYQNQTYKLRKPLIVS
jgi:hypothetical protein